MRLFFKKQKWSLKKKRRIVTSLLFAFLFVAVFPFLIFPSNYAIADDLTQEEIIENIENEVGEQLDDIDFSDIEDILASMSDSANEVFGGTSFLEKIQSIINGDFASSSSSIWGAIINLFFDNIISFLPILATIIAVALLGGMLQGLRPNTSEKSISNVIHFVTYGVIVVLLLTLVAKMVTLTSGTISSMQAQMNAIFPILLTMLTAVGGTVHKPFHHGAFADIYIFYCF